MASYSVTQSKHATLTPDTVDTVTLTGSGRVAYVKNASTTAGAVLYATFDGSTPTVGGDNTVSVHAGEVYATNELGQLVQSLSSAGNDVVVKLISATADPYSVGLD